MYVNHLKGIQVMATINLQCNSPTQIHSSVYFRLKIVWQVCIHERSADTNLVGIYDEMSELLDKEVNVQKKFEKIFRGSHKLPQAHEKVCNENERRKKQLPRKFLW